MWAYIYARGSKRVKFTVVIGYVAVFSLEIRALYKSSNSTQAMASGHW